MSLQAKLNADAAQDYPGSTVPVTPPPATNAPTDPLALMQYIVAMFFKLNVDTATGKVTVSLVG